MTPRGILLTTLLTILLFAGIVRGVFLVRGRLVVSDDIYDMFVVRQTTMSASAPLAFPLPLTEEQYGILSLSHAPFLVLIVPSDCTTCERELRDMRSALVSIPSILTDSETAVRILEDSTLTDAMDVSIRKIIIRQGQVLMKTDAIYTHEDIRSLLDTYFGIGASDVTIQEGADRLEGAGL